MKVKLDINYYKNPIGKKQRWSHKLTEEWTLKDHLHCPNCGRKGVWASDRDCFEVGPEHICSVCGYSFHLPNSGTIVCGVSLQRLELLRAEGATPPGQDDTTLEAVCTLGSGSESPVVIAAKALCIKFTDKVESGRARSCETYAECKALLKMIDSAESEYPVDEIVFIGRDHLILKSVDATGPICHCYKEVSPRDRLRRLTTIEAATDFLDGYIVYYKAKLLRDQQIAAEDAPKSSTRELVFKAGVNDNSHQRPDTLRIILNKSTASEIVDTLKPAIEARFDSTVNFRLMIAGTWIDPAKERGRLNEDKKTN